ncbi:RpnC/YadD family protein [Aliihoeflea sp. PC F10.4]
MSSNPKQQMQWDAVFKSLIPRAHRLHYLIETLLDVDLDGVSIIDSLPTDLSSSTVADALHQSARYKGLRSDGMFWTRDQVISFEYQSTPNAGMRLRFAMYKEALLDHLPNLKNDRWIHVLIYSGRPTKHHVHETIDPDYIPYLTIDLHRVDDQWLDQGTLADAILRLTRKDARSIDDFRRVLERIDSDDSLDAREASTLRSALALASFNKSGLWDLLQKEMLMDEDLKETFEKFLPEFAQQRAHELRDQAIEKQRQLFLDLIEERGGSSDFAVSIAEMDLETFSSQAPEIIRRIMSNDMDSALIIRPSW